jgi:hypothetical protein
MIVQDVLVRANITTGRRLEANWEDQTAEVRDDVRMHNWLEPHERVLVICLVLLVDLFIHRGEELLVNDSWDLVLPVLEDVAGQRLVQRIIAHNVRVLREPC